MLLSGIKRGKKKPKKASEEPSTATSDNRRQNESVADLLRQSIASGKPMDSSVTHPNQNNGDSLQRRIHSERISGDDPAVTVLLPTVPPASQKSEHDMTVTELLQAEKLAEKTDQIAARNALRLGKKRKLKEKTINNGDSDEDERRQLEYLQADNTNDAKSQRRAQARALAQHDQQLSQVKHCWWWLESNQFDQSSLLAMSEHATLALAPTKLSIKVGRHFWIVPISHCESLASATDEIWNDVQRFQDGLRKWAAAEDRVALFTETVLQRKGFWQTRLECCFVKRSRGLDAPLYFRSALVEQAEEWGTHQKLLKTDEKGLRRTVPDGFSYFFVEFTPNQGYAQMIETRDFPKTFGSDTICGMLGKEPLRMRSPSSKSMHDLVSKAKTEFSAFDWTRND